MNELPPPSSQGGSAPANALPPEGMLLVAIVSIQIGAALAVKLFPHLDPIGVAVFRTVLAAALINAVWRPRWDRRVRLHLPLLLLFGLTIAGLNTFFYLAIAHIPLGAAVPIEFLGPLGVAAATSRRLLDLCWIGLATLGVYLLSPLAGTDLDPLGVAYALLGAASWAAFILLSARVGRIFPGGAGLALATVISAIVLLPLGAGHAGSLVAMPSLVVMLCLIALMSTAVPMSLEYEALKRLPPRAYGVLVSLEPAVANVVGAVALGERLGLQQVAAVGCVTAAAIGVAWFSGRSRT